MAVSPLGQSCFLFLCTMNCNLPINEVSMAVISTSPFPCAAWPSPISNKAPFTNTGIKSLLPATNSLLSKLPAFFHGGALFHLPTSFAGATPMLPKKGLSGIRILVKKEPIICCLSSGIIVIFLSKISSDKNPLCPMALYPYGMASCIESNSTSNTSPGSASST